MKPRVEIGPEIIGSLDWDLEHGNITEDEYDEFFQRIIDEQMISILKYNLKYGK